MRDAQCLFASSAPPLIWTYNGRGALFQVLLANRLATARSIVLAPSFHCPTVVDPILASGCAPEYYEVGADLDYDLDSLTARLGPRVSAVIAIQYFGWRRDLAPLRSQCERHGVLLIEDCCHSFLRDAPLRLAGGEGHVAVFSPWKLAPCVTAGVIKLNHVTWHPRPPRPLPFGDQLDVLRTLASEWLSYSSVPAAMLGRAVLRRPLIQGLTQSPDELLPKSPESDREGGAPPIVYPFIARTAESRAALASRWVLKRANLEWICASRRRNYDQLFAQLRFNEAMQPLTGPLPSDVCPWALALRIPARARIDFRLRRAGVPLFTFGETLHESLSRGGTPPDLVQRAKLLADSSMCLPVHQQLSSTEIEWMADKVNAMLGSGSGWHRSSP